MNKLTRTLLFFVLAMMALQAQAFETGQTIRIVNGGKSILVDKNLEFQNYEFPKKGSIKTIRSIFEIPELLKEY